MGWWGPDVNGRPNVKVDDAAIFWEITLRIQAHDPVFGMTLEPALDYKSRNVGRGMCFCVAKLWLK